MSSITDCLEELRAKRQQLDEAIVLLERIGAGGGVVKRRGRPPQWLRAAQAQTTGDTADAVELKPRAVKGPKANKRRMSAEGKLAIQVGVALRQWKAANPDADEDAVAKQREKIRQQLARKGA